METKVDALVRRLEHLNAAYRAGQPEISDADYDALVEELRTHAPDHPFLGSVETEVFDDKRKVRHPEPMLSTNKAYTADELVQ